jgi:hypothetical protein
MDMARGPVDLPTASAASASRKRRHDQGPNNATDNGSETRTSGIDDDGFGDNEPRSKKRRIDPSIGINYVWDFVSEKLARWFSKCFLLAVEVAARNARDGELSEELDVHSALMHMLHYFQADDMEILHRGWRVLCLCSCSMRPQLPAREDSVEEDVATIVTVMQRHQLSARVQLLGCRALKALVSKTDNWKALLKGGALPALVDATRNFPHQKIVQGLCFAFLVMMMREEGADSRRLMIESGAIPLIVQAIRRFVHDGTLVHTGCCALYELSCGTTTTRTNIIEHGAIEVLLMAVERQMRHASLVELCLGTLNQLSLEDNMAGRGVILLMIKLMLIHSERESIQFYCLVLIRAAGRVDRIPHVLSTPVIVSVMRRFQSSSGVLFFGCAVLWQLLTADANNEALDLISSCGGLECVVTATAMHGNVFGLPPVAHLILSHAWENRPPDNESATRAFGGTEGVISLITGLSIEDNDDDDIDD